MKTLFLPLLLLAGTAAAAQDAPPSVELKGTVQLERTTTVDGKAKVELVEPEVVVPGDALVFTTTYRNTGTAAAENFAVTNAVPAPVALAAEGSGTLTVSVDGGKNWGRLAELKVALSEGQERPASADDVTHIRWTVASIAPGGTGQFQYRGRVR